MFNDLDIQVSTTPSHVANVAITLKEKPTKWIKGGVGWGSEEKERVSLTLTHENLFHRAYQLNLTTTFSRIWTEYRADFLNRYLWGSKTELRGESSWRREDWVGYDTEQTQATAGLGRLLFPSIRGSLSYRFRRTGVFNRDPSIALTTPDQSDSRSVIAAVNRDTANDFFSPSKGARTNLTLERSGGFLGGANNFNRAIFESKHYVKIRSGLVGAVAFRSAAVKAFSPSPEVPIFERLFIGGANTIRGYAERDVGPHDVLGSPLGGNYRLGGTVELRFPIYWLFGGAVFIDGGNVGRHPNDVAPSEWLYGTGLGVRLHTPVGPIRLDYGYKVNPLPGDRDLWRLHLSVGEVF
jgi:outer membrane protein insertion porin family